MFTNDHDFDTGATVCASEDQSSPSGPSPDGDYSSPSGSDTEVDSSGLDGEVVVSAPVVGSQKAQWGLTHLVYHAWCGDLDSTTVPWWYWRLFGTWRCKTPYDSLVPKQLRSWLSVADVCDTGLWLGGWVWLAALVAGVPHALIVGGLWTGLMFAGAFLSNGCSVLRPLSGALRARVADPKRAGERLLGLALFATCFALVFWYVWRRRDNEEVLREAREKQIPKASFLGKILGLVAVCITAVYGVLISKEVIAACGVVTRARGLHGVVSDLVKKFPALWGDLSALFGWEGASNTELPLGDAVPLCESYTDFLALPEDQRVKFRKAYGLSKLDCPAFFALPGAEKEKMAKAAAAADVVVGSGASALVYSAWNVIRNTKIEWKNGCFYTMMGALGGLCGLVLVLALIRSRKNRTSLLRELNFLEEGLWRGPRGLCKPEFTADRVVLDGKDYAPYAVGVQGGKVCLFSSRNPGKEVVLVLRSLDDRRQGIVIEKVKPFELVPSVLRREGRKRRFVPIAGSNYAHDFSVLAQDDDDDWQPGESKRHYKNRQYWDAFDDFVEDTFDPVVWHMKGDPDEISAGEMAQIVADEIAEMRRKNPNWRSWADYEEAGEWRAIAQRALDGKMTEKDGRRLEEQLQFINAVFAKTKIPRAGGMAEALLSPAHVSPSLTPVSVSGDLSSKEQPRVSRMRVRCVVKESQVSKVATVAGSQGVQPKPPVKALPGVPPVIPKVSPKALAKVADVAAAVVGKEAFVPGNTALSVDHWKLLVVPVLCDSEKGLMLRGNGFCVGQFFLAPHHLLTKGCVKDEMCTLLVKDGEKILKLEYVRGDPSVDYALFRKPAIPGLRSVPTDVCVNAQYCSLAGWYPKGADWEFRTCPAVVQASGTHNASTECGVSGAPIINGDGRVVLMHLGALTGSDLNVGLPLSKTFIEMLVSNEKLDKKALRTVMETSASSGAQVAALVSRGQIVDQGRREGLLGLCEVKPQVLGHTRLIAPMAQRESVDPFFREFVLENPGLDRMFQEEILEYDHSAMTSVAYQKAVAKYCTLMPTISWDRDWVLAEDWMHRVFWPFMHDAHVSSLGETLFHMAKDTSPGPVLKMWFQNKGEALENGGSVFVHRLLESLDLPGSGMTFAGARLKDEIRPLDRVRDEKTRLFLAFSMDHHVATAMLCDDMNEKLHAAGKHWQVPSTVGISVQGKAFAHIGRRVVEQSEGQASRIHCGDISGYDARMHAAFQEAVAWYRFTCLREQDRTFANLCWFGNLYRDVVQTPTILADGMVVLLDHQPSGFANTSQDNTLVLFLVLAWVWLHNGGPRDFDVFRHTVLLFLYGDDSITALTKEALPFMSKEKIKDALEVIGWEIEFSSYLEFLGHFIMWSAEYDCYVPVYPGPKMSSALTLVGGDTLDHALSKAVSLRITAFTDPDLFAVLDRYVHWLLDQYDPADRYGYRKSLMPPSTLKRMYVPQAKGPMYEDRWNHRLRALDLFLRHCGYVLEETLSMDRWAASIWERRRFGFDWRAWLLDVLGSAPVLEWDGVIAHGSYDPQCRDVPQGRSRVFLGGGAVTIDHVEKRPCANTVHDMSKQQRKATKAAARKLLNVDAEELAARKLQSRADKAAAKLRSSGSSNSNGAGKRGARGVASIEYLPVPTEQRRILAGAAGSSDAALVQEYLSCVMNPGSVQCRIPDAVPEKSFLEYEIKEFEVPVSFQTPGTPNDGRFSILCQPILGSPSSPNLYQNALVNSSVGWPADFSQAAAYTNVVGGNDLRVSDYQDVLTMPELGNYAALGGVPGGNSPFGAAVTILPQSYNLSVMYSSTVPSAGSNFSLPVGTYRVQLVGTGAAGSFGFVTAPTLIPPTGGSIFGEETNNVTDIPGNVTLDSWTAIVNITQPGTIFQVANGNTPLNYDIFVEPINTTVVVPNVDNGIVRLGRPVAMSVWAAYTGPTLTDGGNIAGALLAGDTTDSNYVTFNPQNDVGALQYWELLAKVPGARENPLRKGMYVYWSQKNNLDFSFRKPSEMNAFDYPVIAISGQWAPGQVVSSPQTVVRLRICRVFEFQTEVRLFELDGHFGNQMILDEIGKILSVLPHAMENDKHEGFLAGVMDFLRRAGRWGFANKDLLFKLAATAAPLLL